MGSHKIDEVSHAGELEYEVPVAKRTPARELMIAAAERLFAEHGIDGVSLREVAAEAGQRNNSAAQYHFGNKEGLVRAVFEHRIAEIDDRRRQMVAELDAAGRGTDLRGLVEAAVHPLVEFVLAQPEKSWALRFLAQLVVSPELHKVDLLDLSYAPGIRTVVERVIESLRHLPSWLRKQRLRQATFLIVHSLADGERGVRAGDEASAARLRLLGNHLVDTTVALLTAEVSETTRAALAAAESQTV
ncbi:TetR family transcriptional regulator [Carbonactinospora thermoautotrophica]|uniref:TetR/AcrR family transcriptional regulator n=1 Tax=Carbonactinospora thermoautotrophica TaxID=1469144 RepID=UPI00226FB7D2|nr:helix-turn-helix domain-containing protein [Carbonactinospora thermoautotrophica]MCX9191270.1 TetR family transcriptional regulator [Carbonactinospora thermoautotrophica]